MQEFSVRICQERWKGAWRFPPFAFPAPHMHLLCGAVPRRAGTPDVTGRHAALGALPRAVQVSPSLGVGTSVIPFQWSGKLRPRAVRGLPKVTVRIELCLAPSALCALEVLARACHAKCCVSDLGVTLWSGYLPFSLPCTPKWRPAPPLDALSMKMDFSAPGRCFAFKAPWAAGSRTSKG